MAGEMRSVRLLDDCEGVPLFVGALARGINAPARPEDFHPLALAESRTPLRCAIGIWSPTVGLPQNRARALSPTPGSVQYVASTARRYPEWRKAGHEALEQSRRADRYGACVEHLGVKRE